MSTTNTTGKRAKTTATAPVPEDPEGLEGKLAYLTRVLKPPTIGRAWEALAATARESNWSHEEYLTAVLERQVADRESAGNAMRIRTAHFPQVKTLKTSTSTTCPRCARTCWRI